MLQVLENTQNQTTHPIYDGILIRDEKYSKGDEFEDRFVGNHSKQGV